jgi:cytoskeletal protein RodZ
MFYLNRREFFMQMKHLVVFAIVGMVVLLGFNIINGNQREKNREAITASSQAEVADTQAAVSENNGSDTSSANDSHTSDIVSQPLGQQPKAILDDATSKIDQAQQADAVRLEQMTSAQ